MAWLMLSQVVDPVTAQQVVGIITGTFSQIQSQEFLPFFF
jgi:hypothetical protein